MTKLPRMGVLLYKGSVGVLSSCTNCGMLIIPSPLQLCADSENSLLLKLNPLARTSQVGREVWVVGREV